MFDLDDTLVHCTAVSETKSSDSIVEIHLANGAKTTLAVNIRPNTIDCIKELSNFFDIVIFSSKPPCYANPIIDLIDPYHKLFVRRLFRNDCIENNGYVKDLRVLQCNLKRAFIIDNSIIHFSPQIDNGILINPFYNDQEDTTLIKIKDYIMGLKESEDVRIDNRRTFHLNQLLLLDIENFINLEDRMKDKFSRDDEEFKSVEFEDVDDIEVFRKVKNKKMCYSIIQKNDFLSDPYGIGTKINNKIEDTIEQRKRSHENKYKYKIEYKKDFIKPTSPINQKFENEMLNEIVNYIQANIFEPLHLEDI